MNRKIKRMADNIFVCMRDINNTQKTSYFVKKGEEESQTFFERHNFVPRQLYIARNKWNFFP